MKTNAFLLFVFVGCATISASGQEQKAPGPPASTAGATKAKKVGVEEFDTLRLTRTNIVLDVRTPAEFKNGHIPGAVNLDFRSPDFDKKVAELDKSKTYLVHCAAGGRSARACQKMGEIGFKELYDLQLGFTGWQKAGRPVEK